MANADIVSIGPDEYELLANLFNRIAAPPVDRDYFERRFRGRYNTCNLLAQLEREPVGFVSGYELRPSTFYIWLIGVLSDTRRLGIASQLLSAIEAWSAERHYENLRFECPNRYKPMIHTTMSHGFDIVGIRWDHERADNLIILEKYSDDIL
jgi:GNAT superfamily N-acetyltransferase